MPRKSPTHWLDDAAVRAGAFELELTRVRRLPRTRRFGATVGAAALLCAVATLSAGATTLVPDPDQPPAAETTITDVATTEAATTIEATTTAATTTETETTETAPEEAPTAETAPAATTTAAPTTTEAAPTPEPTSTSTPAPAPPAPGPVEEPADDAIVPVPGPAGTLTEAAPAPAPAPRPVRRTSARHVQVSPVLPPAPAPASAPPAVVPPASFDVGAWENDHPGSSVGATAAWIAQQYLGTPYVWGGAAPGEGFDCSGLVLYAYGRLGISLPHYAAAQYALFPHLQPSDLRPGDLVFFEPKLDGPGHVAIYLGGDRIVEAPYTGADVRIGSLSGSAAALGFVGAVRPYRTFAASTARVTVDRSQDEVPFRLLSGRALHAV